MSTIRVGLTVVGWRLAPYIIECAKVVNLGDVEGRSERLTVRTCELKGTGPWLGKTETSPPALIAEGGLVEETRLDAIHIARKYCYEVRFEHAPEPGDVIGEVLLRASTREQETVQRVPVRGLIPPAVVCVPRSLYYNILPGMPPPKFVITLAARDTSFNLEAEAAVRKSGEAEVRQVSRAPGRIIYEVSWAGDLRKSISTALRFHTNHPKNPAIEVPMTIRVSGTP